MTDFVTQRKIAAAGTKATSEADSSASVLNDECTFKGIRIDICDADNTDGHCDSVERSTGRNGAHLRSQLAMNLVRDFLWLTDVSQRH
jgi:hypothetical protein